MYLKLSKNRTDRTYEGNQIKELSFAPDYDPTMCTYPVCEFEAKIYDATVSESDLLYSRVYLHGKQPSSSSDFTTLLAGYYRVNEVKTIERNLFYIKAQSVLAELEDINLSPVYLDHRNAESYITEIFSNAGLYDAFVIFAPYSDSELHGYCPRQTARERLAYVVQSLGCMIVQWGSNTAEGIRIYGATDARTDSSYASYSADELPYKKTYKVPIIKKKDAVDKYTYKKYILWSTTQPTTSGWDSVILYYYYDLEGDRTPVYLYYKADMQTIGSGAKENSLPDNMLISGSTSALNGLARAHFRPMTAEMDVLIDDGNYSKVMPSNKVEFYADDTTMYSGVIRSARFTSGLLTRVHLEIDVDPNPITLVHCRFNYRYVSGNDTRALGHRDYYIKPDNYFTVYHPTFKSYVVDRWETFTPQTASTTIQPSQDTTTTINYNRAST